MKIDGQNKTRGTRKEAGVEPVPRPYRDIINREMVRDDRLSLRALGVAVRLLSNAPGFKMTSTDLARERPEGRDAIRTALAELEAAGYLRRARRQLPNGQWITEVMISDELRVKPTPENPVPVAKSDSPTPENPAPVPNSAPPTPENPAPAPKPEPPTPENPVPVPKPDPPAPENPTPVPRPDPPTPENPAVGGSGSQSSNSSTSNISTTTTTVGLAWPPALGPAERVVVDEIIQGMDQLAQQQLLDELAGALRSKIPPRRLASWMSALRKRYETGQFVPDLGLPIAKERSRRAMEATARQERQQQVKRPRPNREEIARIIAKARAEIGFGPLLGTDRASLPGELDSGSLPKNLQDG